MEAVEWSGPPTNFGQWTMERVCGQVTDKVRSRSQANRNLSIALLISQQLHAIPLFLYTSDDGYSSSDDSSSSESGQLPACYNAIMRQVQSVKARGPAVREKKTMTSSWVDSLATLTNPQSKYKLKAWEVTLLRKYLYRQNVEVTDKIKTTVYL